MDDPRFDIWKVLHDAAITVTGHEAPDVVLMFVTIPFVRRRIAPLGASFKLRLGGFRSLEFRWGHERDGHRMADLYNRVGVDGTAAENEKGPYGLDYVEGMTILGTTSSSKPVEVEMAEGLMTIDFDSLDIILDSGQPVSYEQVHQAAQKYWMRTKPVD